MELTIKIEGTDNSHDAEDLKKFLENRPIAGLTEIGLSRSAHNEGEQGLGKFLGDLIVKATGAEEFFKGLFTVLNSYATQHDKRIHLGNGIVIPAVTLTNEQIYELVVKALK
jgi:hypothetical protein